MLLFVYVHATKIYYFIHELTTPINKIKKEDISVRHINLLIGTLRLTYDKLLDTYNY